MLRWFVIGAFLGPVLLVMLGFFVSNPGVLWWVAGLVAALFIWGLVLGLRDVRAGTRARQAVLAEKDGEIVAAAVVRHRAPPTTIPAAAAAVDVASAAVLAEHKRLRRDYRGWRFASPAGKGRAAGE